MKRRPLAGHGRPAPAAPDRSHVARQLREAAAMHRAGQLAAAEEVYRAVLALAPGHPDALHLLGFARYQAGRDGAAAARLIERAIAAQPQIAAYHVSLTAVRLHLGDVAAAEAAAVRACRLAPDLPDAQIALGNVRSRQGDVDAAIVCYREAARLRPTAAEPLNNLGAALLRAGKLDEAEAAIRQAIAFRPGDAGQFANLGLVLREQGRWDEARRTFDAAIAANPEHAAARANRAIALLQAGEWREGWAEYEWRWRAPGFTTAPRPPSRPAWDGGVLAGRTLLLHAEQGYGSAIQFIRYAAPIAARQIRVLVECPAPLVRLFRQSLMAPAGPVADVVERGRRLPAHDRQAPLMSLPHLLGTTLATVPADVPYLRAEAGEVALWRQRLAGLGEDRDASGAGPAGPLSVGIAWAGHPAHGNDRNRSLPPEAAAALLAPLLKGLPQVRFVSLQTGKTAENATAASLAPLGLADWSRELVDFAATAALIEALDLVVSVDTAVAHLAGALARPVWLLLPHVGEWRWLIDRPDSPWYPTMRIFRQRAIGDWPELIGRVGADLASAVAGGR